MTAIGSADRKDAGMVNAMPALFFGHGNPMHTLTPNRYAQAWQRVGQRVPRPKVILSISPGEIEETQSLPRRSLGEYNSAKTSGEHAKNRLKGSARPPLAGYKGKASPATLS
jgi:hypothetical protein